MLVVIGVMVSSLSTGIRVKADRFHPGSPARDYVEGMWLMLQQSAPEDFVLATGETHPVREFVDKSFSVLGIQLKYVPLSSCHIFFLPSNL